MENSITTCTHFGHRCRNLIGCWTSVELKLAVAEGYTICQVYQICHFSEGSVTLFKPFILEMLKGKLEATGFPKNVTNENEKWEYIRTIKKNTGCDLKYECIR